MGSIRGARMRRCMRWWLFVGACVLLMGCGGGGGGGGGDTASQATQIVPRSFHLGFTPFPHAYTVAAVEAAYDVISNDADMVVQHLDDGIPWAEALDNADNGTTYRDTYAANLVGDLDYKFQHNPAGHALYLAVTPLDMMREGLALHRGDSSNEALTPPWDGYDLDDPLVIRAYIQHCMNMIDHFDPDFFVYAIEANILAAHDKLNGTNKWSDFVTLAGSVYSALKARHPDLPVSLSLQVGFFHADVSEQTAAIAQILPYTDSVAISAYPFTDIPDPADLPADYFSRLTDLAPSKPVVIAETAWPAEDLEDVNNPGTIIAAEDPQRQQKYIRFLIDEMDRLNGRFLVLFCTRDYDDFWESDLKNDSNAQLIRTWRDTGLYDGAGNPRPALDIWQEALERPKS